MRENPSPAASSLGKMDLSRPLVDVDVARCKVGLDRENYLALCEILLDEQDHIDAELRRARLLGPNAVIKALHELANSIAVLGVTQVATELRSLELALRDTPPPGAAEKAVDFALEIFGRICAEVRAIVQKFRGEGGGDCKASPAQGGTSGAPGVIRRSLSRLVPEGPCPPYTQACIT